MVKQITSFCPKEFCRLLKNCSKYLNIHNLPKIHDAGFAERTAGYCVFVILCCFIILKWKEKIAKSDERKEILTKQRK